MSRWTEFRDDMIGRARTRADSSWDDLEKALRDTGDSTVIQLLDRHLGFDEVLQELLTRADATPRGQAIRGALEHLGRNLVGYLLGGAGVTGALTLPAALMSWQSIPMLLLLLAGGASIVRNRHESIVRNGQDGK